MYIHVLTVELEDRLVEVKGEQWFWKFPQEEFDEDSCKMWVSVGLQVHIMA